MGLKEFILSCFNRHETKRDGNWIDDVKEGEALLMQALVENDQERKVEYLLEAAKRGNHVAVRTLSKMGHPAGESAAGNQYPYSVDSDLRLSDRLQREVSGIHLDDGSLENVDGKEYVLGQWKGMPIGMARGFYMYKRWIEGGTENDRKEAMALFEKNLPEDGYFHPEEMEAVVILAEYYRHRDKKLYRKYCLIGAKNGHPLLAYAYAVILKREGILEEAMLYLKTAMNDGTDATGIAARFQFATIYMQSGETFSHYHDDAQRYIMEGIRASDKVIMGEGEAKGLATLENGRIKDEYFGFYILQGQFYLKDRENAANEATYNDLTDHALMAFENAFDKIYGGGGPGQLALVAAKELSNLLLVKGKTDEAEYYNKKCRELSVKDWG